MWNLKAALNAGEERPPLDAIRVQVAEVWTVQTSQEKKIRLRISDWRKKKKRYWRRGAPGTAG